MSLILWWWFPELEKSVNLILINVGLQFPSGVLIGQWAPFDQIVNHFLLREGVCCDGFMQDTVYLYVVRVEQLVFVKLRRNKLIV